jgi:3-hydroxybutyryl-CoA dehydratase
MNVALQKPSEFKLADLYAGQEVSFSATAQSDEGISSEMQALFLRLTGDNSPCHVDEGFAREKRFKGKLVYGMLTASFYSTLVGVYLPGKYALLQEARIDFSRPVYIGDRLTVKGKIAEIDPVLKRAYIKAEIRNQSDKRVSKASLAVGLTE